jgi:hypothetical protein
MRSLLGGSILILGGCLALGAVAIARGGGGSGGGVNAGFSPSSLPYKVACLHDLDEHPTAFGIPSSGYRCFDVWQPQLYGRPSPVVGYAAVPVPARRPALVRSAKVAAYAVGGGCYRIQGRLFCAR